MKIAYLVNQYPKVSHSFIRRELLALEELNIEVYRFSIRKTPLGELVDQTDISEHEKTFNILSQRVSIFFAGILSIAVMSPFCFLKALTATFQLGLNSKRGILRHLFYLTEACLLKKELSYREVTHLHAHFGTNPAAVAMLCKILGGPNYSFTVHGPEEFDDPEGFSLGKKIENCKFVVAISNFGRSQLMRQCSHEHWSKIKIIHCTVDNSFLAEPATPIPESPRLLCVGRLCEQKGQLLLIKALRLLDQKGIDFQMVLAGDGEMRPVIEELIARYKLQDKISITGWLSSEQVKYEIKASRVMVLPSFAEGLPVVIMEALALSRPVVSTYIAGIPELVEPCINGWLVPAGNVDILANTLEKVLSADKGQLERMGQVGARIVKKQHNDLTEAKKLTRLFVAGIV